MKSVVLAMTAVLVFSCASKNQTVVVRSDSTQQTNIIRPTLTSFVDTLKKLEAKSPENIDSAVRLFDILAPGDSTSADSASATLLGFIQKAVDLRNRKFEKDTVDFSALVYSSGQAATEKQKALISQLHEEKLKLVGDGEGGVYTVPHYETILPAVKEKTSLAVDQYLDLVAKEDTTPAFLDAGLAIEMTELVDRLVLSEALLGKKLPASFSNDLAKRNHAYTTALVQGSDNSPALEDDQVTLTDEYRQGYDYLLAKYPATKAAQRINVWTAVIKSGDKKKVNDYLKLLGN